MAVPPAPVRVPSQRPRAPSVESVTSVSNDKGDNEMNGQVLMQSQNICSPAVLVNVPRGLTQTVQ